METHSLRHLPILGICGCSGVGKTTLIENILASRLVEGLKIVVIKYQARNVTMDVAGKDSDRYFRAGADVRMVGEAFFSRFHEQQELQAVCRELSREYDLVLVEGHARTDVPKIWLLGENHHQAPEGVDEVMEIFSRRMIEEGDFFSWLARWLADISTGQPVWGAVLIGGQSSRMGRPKHLLEVGGVTWVERTVDLLGPKVEQVVISGKGELPAGLRDLPRIEDAPGTCGPLAGILSLLRWQPWCGWLVAATDQPFINADALAWLLSQRRLGVRAVLPDLRGNGKVEPLLAYYDPRCQGMLEREAMVSPSPRPGCLKSMPGVLTPQPPEQLRDCWRNVNTREEWALLRESGTL